MTGVYQIQSKIKPERIYIGSAVDIGKRQNIHRCLLGKNSHHSPKLQNHYNKYGADDFIFSIVDEFCFVSKEHLLEREQYYIDTLNPWFNTRLFAESNLGIKRVEKKRRKPCSQETKDKLSRAHKGKKLSAEHIQKMREANLGKKQSPELIAKRREAMIGHKHSEETRKKISENTKGKKRSPEFCDKMRKIRIGKKDSDEVRENKRLASPKVRPWLYGKPTWNKGKKMTAEFKKKLSDSHKGKKQSLETILKRKESRKGYVPTEETKKKMSDAQKGKKVSDITKDKLRTINKGNKHALGNKSRTGRHNSAETNKKISEGRKRYFANKKMKDDEAGN